MSLNKFKNVQIGKDIKLNIGCENLECVNSLIIKTGDSNDLNYTTPDLGQPNYSLHTDGAGGTFWSPDDTGSSDLTYAGIPPVAIGQHIIFKTTDAKLVEQSAIIESGGNMDVGGLNITNVGDVDGVDVSALEIKVGDNEADIMNLDTDKLDRDGTQAMTGNLNMDSKNINNVQDLNINSLGEIKGASGNKLIMDSFGNSILTLTAGQSFQMNNFTPGTGTITLGPVATLSLDGAPVRLTQTPATDNTPTSVLCRNSGSTNIVNRDVSSIVSDRVAKAGDSMSGNLDMTNNQLLNVSNVAGLGLDVKNNTNNIADFSTTIKITNNTSSNCFAGFGNGLLNSGTFNTAFGRQGLANNTTASNNTAVGGSALRLMTTSPGNTAVGAVAGSNISTGLGNNTCVGLSSGSSLTIGENCTLLGSGTNPSTNGATYAIAIGKNAVAPSKQMVIGGPSAPECPDVIRTMVNNTCDLGSSSIKYKDAYLTRAIVAQGTALLPSLTFDGDTNTGIYNSSADVLGLVVGGTEQLTINTSQIISNTTLNMQSNEIKALQVSKAWCETKQTSLGTQFNVDSISQNATGDFTLKFTNAMVDDTYNVQLTTYYDGNVYVAQYYDKLTSEFKMHFTQQTALRPVDADPTFWRVVVFGV